MSEICDVFKIIHRKDGVYDLFQDNNLTVWFHKVVQGLKISYLGKLLF